VKRLRLCFDVLRDAAALARDNLGVPQPGYPAPVAVAAKVLQAALDRIESVMAGET
jgi:hypothetical protein